jgi:glutamyl-tRNA reductase
MMLLTVGCNFRDTPVDLREKLAFAEAGLPRALSELSVRYGCEAVILSTCNRVELYLGWAVPAGPVQEVFDADLIAEFLGEWHQLPATQLRPHLYQFRDRDAVHHLFRVVASLDSMIVGEGQIAGQVKQAYEQSQQVASVGALLHALFQQARVVAKRVRSETGISAGHVSVSSVAVDYVRQVFERFDDKTVLVIGAGKMGELTLKHLRELTPKRILVTNRSPEKAQAVAEGCGGAALPWEQLDDALVRADIVLSTTGAPEVIVSRERWTAVLSRRKKGSVVILDIAVPRDFDPAIHNGERTCLFNIDDLQRIREQTLEARRKYVAPAEAIVEHEVSRFLKDWQRRQMGPVIARLTQELEAKRRVRWDQVFEQLDGRLTDDDRRRIEGASRLQQNEVLHVLITAMNEATSESGGHKLLEMLRKLFRLE